MSSLGADITLELQESSKLDNHPYDVPRDIERYVSPLFGSKSVLKSPHAIKVIKKNKVIHLAHREQKIIITPVVEPGIAARSLLP